MIEEEATQEEEERRRRQRVQRQKQKPHTKMWGIRPTSKKWSPEESFSNARRSLNKAAEKLAPGQPRTGKEYGTGPQEPTVQERLPRRNPHQAGQEPCHGPANIKEQTRQEPLTSRKPSKSQSTKAPLKSPDQAAVRVKMKPSKSQNTKGRFRSPKQVAKKPGGAKKNTIPLTFYLTLDFSNILAFCLAVEVQRCTLRSDPGR